MNRQVRYVQAARGLNEAIFQLTWLGEFWAMGGALVLSEVYSYLMVHHLGHSLSDMCGARSSTYYSAAGNAFVRARHGRWSKPLWYAVATLCFIRAYRLSTKMLLLVGGDEKKLSADQLDVRSAILLRAKRLGDARVCKVLALEKPDIKLNTRVLLLTGMAEIDLAQGDVPGARMIANQVTELIKEHAASDGDDSIQLSTKIRFSRLDVRILQREGRHKEADTLKSLTERLARDAGLLDQELKVQAQ